MQKKLIALALAGLASTAAFADNASVYGVLDAAWVATSGSGLRSASSVIASGLATSRIGFNISEDLGNGTTVIGNLEYAIDTQNNTAIGSGNAIVNSGTIARQQLLGLKGAWGTFATGYLQTAAKTFGDKYDVATGSTVSPYQNITKGGKYGTKGLGFLLGGAGGATRAGSAMAYISPDMSGFTVAVNYAYLNQLNVLDPSGKSSNSPITLISANYDNGPLSVGFVAAHASNVGASSTTPVYDTNITENEWGAGVSYNFGVATVKALYDATHTNEGGTAGDTNSVWSLGAVIPAGPGNVLVSYAKSKIATTATDDNSTGYTLGYLYPLSKRTTVYGAYSHQTNQTAGMVTVDNNALKTNLTAGGSSTLFALGLNHKF